MAGLCDLSCKACRGEMEALTGERLAEYVAQVADWEIVEDHHLSRTFRFADFAGALELVNRVGALAEAEGHHPNIHLAWGRVRIDIWTHKADGLTVSDFVLAAKIDAL